MGVRGIVCFPEKIRIETVQLEFGKSSFFKTFLFQQVGPGKLYACKKG